MQRGTAKNGGGEDGQIQPKKAPMVQVLPPMVLGGGKGCLKKVGPPGRALDADSKNGAQRGGDGAPVQEAK